MKLLRSRNAIAVAAAGMLAVAVCAGGGTLGVRASVDAREVYVGDSFRLTIQVQGTDKPEKPDLSGLADFEARFIGGQPSNSESITVINGRMTRVVRRSYVMAYALSPRRAGQLTIPAITVTAEGEKLTHEPILIVAREPEETADLKLRLALSKHACYVGEPIVLTVTWYLARDVRGFAFRIPVLTDPRFKIDDVDLARDRTKEYLRIPLDDGEVIGEKGQGTLDGKTFTTVSFQKVLLPQQAGTLAIPRAFVACQAYTGSARRPRSIFDDDFFNRGRRSGYRKFVVPSNELSLEVRALPAEGRPAGFAGHVGEYRVEATAAPTEVNVGDPITLTVRISGPPCLKHVELPPLAAQPAFARAFKIPKERAEAKSEGTAKVFTQSVRATRDDVAAVPPIELAYFDTKTGRYAVARSEPIPLTVHATKVVTARDAEGREGAPVTSELKALSEGIAYNYEDLGVLESQDHGLRSVVRDPFWLAVTGIPFAAYLVLLGATAAARRRRADPAAREARRAFRDLRAAVRPLRSAEGDTSAGVLDALRTYLGAKLTVPAAAITHADIEQPLRQRGVPDDTLASLRSLFERCEAGRYAGAAAEDGQHAQIVDDTLRLARDLERRLR